VRATSKLSVVHSHSVGCKITGIGVILVVSNPTNATEWAERYGVELDGTKCTLYKAVSGDYSSPHGVPYRPGTQPAAADWDGGKRECGGGLHFSPSPVQALEFYAEAKRFVACPCDLKDAVFNADAVYPQKVKLPGVCGPVWECDMNGKAIVS
jgi:hypothetical protein